MSRSPVPDPAQWSGFIFRRRSTISSAALFVKVSTVIFSRAYVPVQMQVQDLSDEHCRLPRCPHWRSPHMPDSRLKPPSSDTHLTCKILLYAEILPSGTIQPPAEIHLSCSLMKVCPHISALIYLLSYPLSPGFPEPAPQSAYPTGRLHGTGLYSPAPAYYQDP